MEKLEELDEENKILMDSDIDFYIEVLSKNKEIF